MIHDYEQKLAAQQAEALRDWGGRGVLGRAASNVAGGSGLDSVREPELRSLIDRVHSSISVAEAALSSLGNRLSPVMRSAGPEPGAMTRSLGDLGPGVSTEYSSMLAGAVERLDTLHSRIADVLDRLEV